MDEYQEQHAIPQQVSAYQFRLVGDMTLKQFFQLAGGALISLLFYSTTLPPVVKWPLIMISFLLGVAFAFFPLQDRPLAKWFELFFKAIYTPTLYVWKKSDVKRQYFKAENITAAPVEIPAQQALPETPAKTKDEPLTPAEEMVSAQTTLERTEVEFLSQVSQHLGPVKLQRAPQEQSLAQDHIAPQPEVKQVQVPQVQAVGTDQVGVAQEAFKVAPVPEGADSSSATRRPTPFVAQQSIIPAQDATFTPEASPPIPPTTPNIVVGQVLDGEGKILDNTILEIRDSYGRPSRALKTNKLGHFTIATPLYDGKYEILVEKEGYDFDPISIEAKGEIFQPISIIAKSKTGDQVTNNGQNQDNAVYDQKQKQSE